MCWYCEYEAARIGSEMGTVNTADSESQYFTRAPKPNTALGGGGHTDGSYYQVEEKIRFENALRTKS